jgi:hypothetical protein
MGQLGSRLRYRASPKTLRTRGQGQIGYAARPQATPTVSHGRSVVPQPPRPSLSPGRRNRFTPRDVERGCGDQGEVAGPEQLASLKPFGIGEEHPNNYLELWSAFKENRDQARYAWRILTQGVEPDLRCGFSAESCPPRSSHTSPLASLAISRHPRSRRTHLAGRPLDLDRRAREGPRGRRGKTRSCGSRCPPPAHRNPRQYPSWRPPTLVSASLSVLAANSRSRLLV